MPIEVRKVVLEGVSDASGLAALIDEGVFTADEVIAVVGKTEGNGGVNDFTVLVCGDVELPFQHQRGGLAQVSVKVTIATGVPSVQHTNVP